MTLGKVCGGKLRVSAETFIPDVNDCRRWEVDISKVSHPIPERLAPSAVSSLRFGRNAIGTPGMGMSKQAIDRGGGGARWELSR